MWIILINWCQEKNHLLLLPLTDTMTFKPRSNTFTELKMELRLSSNKIKFKKKLSFLPNLILIKVRFTDFQNVFIPTVVGLKSRSLVWLSILKMKLKNYSLWKRLIRGNKTCITIMFRYHCKLCILANQKKFKKMGLRSPLHSSKVFLKIWWLTSPYGINKFLKIISTNKFSYQVLDLKCSQKALSCWLVQFIQNSLFQPKAKSLSSTILKSNIGLYHRFMEKEIF